MAHIKCEQRRKKTCLFPLWKLKKEGISQEGGVQNGRTTDHTMPLATTILLLPILDIFFHPGGSWGQGSAVSVVHEDHQEARAKSSCQWI